MKSQTPTETTTIYYNKKEGFTFIWLKWLLNTLQTGFESRKPSKNTRRNAYRHTVTRVTNKTGYNIVERLNSKTGNNAPS